MSTNLKQCAQVITFAGQVRDNKLRKKILDHFSCNENIFDAITEIAINTQKGNLKLTATQKTKLRKQKKLIEALSCSKANYNKQQKKSLVNQSGGFLAVVAPIIATIIAELLRK